MASAHGSVVASAASWFACLRSDFARSKQTMEQLFVSMVTEGELIVMDDESIHSVKNPSPGRLSSSLPVYGGDLVGTATACGAIPV